MLEFDHHRFVVRYLARSVVLQPLSFKLLLELYKKPNEVVCTRELIDKVWPNTTVSPDTLKQRVFVLRKALDSASFEELEIQAIRGEGYRLCISSVKSDFTPPHHIAMTRPRAIIIGILFSVALCATILAIPVEYTPNTRVLIWTDTASGFSSLNDKLLLEKWRATLEETSLKGELQLVMSSRIYTMLVPEQAEKDRAGLISHIEKVYSEAGEAIRLSIVEPTTATILKSEVASVVDSKAVDELFQRQSFAIGRLLTSRKLCMTEAQRENSQDPIWSELRRIANQT